MTMNLGRAVSQDEHVTTPTGSEHGRPSCKKKNMFGMARPPLSEGSSSVFIFCLGLLPYHMNLENALSILRATFLEIHKCSICKVNPVRLPSGMASDLPKLMVNLLICSLRRN